MDDSGNGLMESNALAAETLVIALFSPILWEYNTNWNHDWIFRVALGIVIVLLFIRFMGSHGKDPDVDYIKRTLRWSSRALDIALIGALAAISIHLSSYTPFVSPISVFTALAIIVSTGLALIDLRVVGEYAETWSDIIHEETGDNQVGYILREAALVGEDQLNSLQHDESSDSTYIHFVAMGLAIGLLFLLLLVTLPAWLILSWLFQGWSVAILVVVSLLILRDATRYIYIRYGAASSLSDLRYRLRWEFMWTILKGGIVAGALGYRLPLGF